MKRKTCVRAAGDPLLCGARRTRFWLVRLTITTKPDGLVITILPICACSSGIIQILVSGWKESYFDARLLAEDNRSTFVSISNHPKVVTSIKESTLPM